MNINVKWYLAAGVNEYFTNQMLTVFVLSIFSKSVFDTHQNNNYA